MLLCFRRIRGYHLSWFNSIWTFRVCTSVVLRREKSVDLLIIFRSKMDIAISKNVKSQPSLAADRCSSENEVNKSGHLSPQLMLALTTPGRWFDKKSFANWIGFAGFEVSTSVTICIMMDCCGLCQYPLVRRLRKSKTDGISVERCSCMCYQYVINSPFDDYQFFRRKKKKTTV